MNFRMIRQRLTNDAQGIGAMVATVWRQRISASAEECRTMVLQNSIFQLDLAQILEAKKSLDARPFSLEEARRVVHLRARLAKAIAEPSPARSAIELMEIGKRLTTYAAFVMIPALATIKRFPLAVSVVRALVNRFRRDDHQYVLGAGNKGIDESTRYLLLGPAVSSLIVHYPYDRCNNRRHGA